jgi:hypothetical protein
VETLAERGAHEGTTVPELRLTTTFVARTVRPLSTEEFASLFCIEAWRALARNKLRSTLAALAIMIGIASVVSVVAIGRAGSERAEEQMRNLGENFVWSIGLPISALIVAPGISAIVGCPSASIRRAPRHVWIRSTLYDMSSATGGSSCPCIKVVVIVARCGTGSRWICRSR